MKKIYCIVFSLATILFAASCTQETLVENGGGIVIRLGLDGLDTKAAATGGELTVNRLDVYVFKADETTKLYYTQVLSPSLTDGKYVQETNLAGMSNLTGSDSEKEAIVKAAKVYAIANYPGPLTGNETLADLKALPITDAQYREGGNVKADPVFVMTGESAFASGGTGVTVADVTLKRVTAKMTVKVNFAASPITTTGTDGSFGETTTTWEPMTGGSNFRVMLQNAVSGATLGGVAPTPSAAKAAGQLYSYGQQNMVADGGSGYVSPAFYTYPVQWTSEGAGDENAPFIKLVLPWKYTTTNNVAKGGTPAGTVIDQNVVERYYKVILPGLTELESNTWYQPTVTLTVKPGEGNEPVVITPDEMQVLKIQGWNNPTGSDIPDVDIESSKFLVPETTAITVNNGNGLQVKYYASSEVTVTVESITMKTYENDKIVEKLVYHPTQGTSSGISVPSFVDFGEAGAWFTNTFKPEIYEGTIQLAHTLSGDIDDDDNSDNSYFSARPYVYSLKLHLNADGADKSLDKTVVITQNPPMMVEGQMSWGYVSVDNQTTEFGSIYRAREESDAALAEKATDIQTPLTFPGKTNRFLNMIYQRGGNSGKVVKIISLGKVSCYSYLDPDDDNSCRFRIIVKATSSSKSYIADPRVSSKSNATLNSIINKHKTGYSSAQNSDQGNFNKAGNPLANYKDGEYPSDLKIDEYKPATRESNYVAPEFMFASSYGSSSNIRYEQAVLRCLAYQEDGYPAGRWRLPTEAEIELCIKMQEKGVIPDLFNSADTEYGYIASSGRRYVYDSSKDSWQWKALEGSAYDGSTTDLSGVSAYPRCVYDTWYWGREEESALITGTYDNSTGVTPGSYTPGTGKYPVYQWSGWDYTTK